MIYFSLFIITLIGSVLGGLEPNPPVWPSTVSVFSPDMSSSDIEGVVGAAYAINGGDPRTSCNNGEFSSERFAFLFMPGTYRDLDVPIGYYTSAYGLGMAPTDTVFDGGKGVYAEEACGSYETGALTTFWRSAENFHSMSNYTWEVGTGMSWVVSQAAPLRNVKVDNDLLFFEYLSQYCCAAGYASGGWGSGVDVGGRTKFGSQQQFMIRSSSSGGGFEAPVWNGVFVGVNGAPAAQCGESNTESSQASIAVEPTVPLVAEKPYVTTLDGGKSYKLIVPSPQTDSSGLSWTSTGYPSAKIIDFSDVYVTQPGDSSETINAKLSAGLHVVVSPGVYSLDSSLVIPNENQVLLGLGLATLIAPSNGEPCIRISDVPGVRVAGVLLEAGHYETNGAMLQVGESGAYIGVASNPTVLTDVFARVGGPSTGVGPVGTMILIQSGYTVIDNTWLWRADHGVDGLTYNSENPVFNGLIVNADNVFAYGLAVEHTIEDNVVWNGSNGLTYFFQAEIMYDYLDSTWDHSCYKLGENVDGHIATGMGCYSYFRDAASRAPIGINTAGAKNIKIDKTVSVFLNGVSGSGIDNVIDSDGLAVGDDNHVNYHC